MLNNNYICGVDIGSSKIAACVVEIKKRRVTNIFFDVVASKGVRQGAIVDSIQLTASLDRVLKNLKNKSRINIKFIYLNISGMDIITKHSQAIIPLAERGNKVITPTDVQKVIDEARILGSSLEEEIIHAIPFGFTIDSRKDISNPIGLYSHRLEADLYLVCGRLSSIQNITRIANQGGYEIKDLFFSGIATSKIVLGRKIREGLNIVCDVGSDITELLFFKDGMLREIKILDIGGDDLTQELATALKIPLDLAEEVKKTHGLVGDESQLEKDKEILVKQSNLYNPFKQKLVVQILTTKTKQICQMIKENIEQSVPYAHIDNFIVTGRTTLLEGFLETLESTLGLPVKFGKIADSEAEVLEATPISSQSSYIRDIISLANKEDQFSGRKCLTYITALGLIYQAVAADLPLSSSVANVIRNPILKIFNKAKEVYQEYF